MSAKASFLDNEAQLSLSGDGIAGFLQGQLTCDTRPMSPTRAIAGALCNPKGRVITDVYGIQVYDQHSILRLRTSLAGKTQPILARYAQFSRINVSIADTPRSLLGVYASVPADMNIAALESMPATADEVHGTADCLWLRRGPCHGEILALGDRGLEELNRVYATLEHGEESQWQLEEMRQGHYALDSEDSERFTPQALNYDITGRVAFDKGCYTGQEVVARLHYKGQSKRRLRMLRSETPVIEEPGSNIIDASGARQGTLLRIVADENGGQLVAAELAVSSIDDSLSTESGISLTDLGIAGPPSSEGP